MREDREDSILVIHISKERYDKIRAQGYKLPEYPSDDWDSIRKRLDGGNTLYHIPNADEDTCSECHAWRASVKVETPSDLESLKLNLRYGPFPTINIDRAGFDLDLCALNFINEQVKLIQEASDYTRYNLNIQRLPITLRGSTVPWSVTMPDK